MVDECEKKTNSQNPYNVFMDGILRDYFGFKPGDPDPVERDPVEKAYKRFGGVAREILAYARQDPKRARDGVEAVERRMEAMGLPWTLHAVPKWFIDWQSDPEGFERETKKIRR